MSSVARGMLLFILNLHKLELVVVSFCLFYSICLERHKGAIPIQKEVRALAPL